jgi:hypothetical protein
MHVTSNVWGTKKSATGTRARVAWVWAEYPNQLDYSGSCQALEPLHEHLSPARQPLSSPSCESCKGARDADVPS